MRLAIRSVSAAAIAAACLALASCTAPGGSISAGAADAQGQQAAPGKPASQGTVTVKQGNKVICVMTVVNGKGTCQVPAAKFGMGTSRVYASYSDNGKDASRSRPVSMTVTPAPTVTALTITPAEVTYGKEQAARLSVKVTGAHGGTPTGTVKVTSGRVTACLIKLTAVKGGGAQGGCTLAAARLAAGARPLTAVYAGDHWYRGSVSSNKTLTVVK